VVVDNHRFVDYFENESGERSNIYSNLYLNLSEFESGAVFFDLDVAWTATLKRSYLLPVLRKQGVKIVALIYDIMEITHFQYFTEYFTYTFMEFIGAHIQYADLTIVTTQASFDILEEFSRNAGVGTVPGIVANLGADFKQKTEVTLNVREDIEKIAAKGKYILMVGTIEPRKNHQLVLEAFDKGIDEMGYNLIFAGRIGWKCEEFLVHLQEHPLYNKRIFHLSDASNTDIDFLYHHAFLVAFPTHMEGFGLPLVEALERGVPVIATNIEVLKEIGKEYCYYFEDDSAEDFIRCLRSIEKEKDLYMQKRECLKSYRPVTWDQSAKIMMDAILSIGNDGKESYG
jgi:glycosyltransferase involved in cell wall biosynthesis